MAGLPDHILRRSAEARAKAEGRDVEEVFAELKGEAPPKPAAPAEPETSAPDAEQPSAAESAEEPAEEPAAAPSGATTMRDLDTESQQYGVPVALLQRAIQARAKREGRELVAAGAPAATTEAGAVTPTPAAAAEPTPRAAPPAIPEGVTTQRLLTVVKAGAIQQVKSTPTDKVSVWPHLLAIEFVALMVVLAGLIIFSVFVDAPLLEFANFNEQPNPSKAPWYFLGLQELLSYFDPQVAGVIIPGFGLVGLAMIPYVDKNPAVKPSDRKLAIMIFSFFVFAAAILTTYGSFFRGPGFNFTFPWTDGIFFDF
jgi:hypothetical protein